MEVPTQGTEEVYEYSPETEKPTIEEVAPDANVDARSLEINDAFHYFAKSDDTRRAYEAPRLKLARLQREAAELRTELEGSSDSGAALLHDVDSLLTSLDRMSAGLPATPNVDDAPDPKAAAQAAIDGVASRTIPSRGPHRTGDVPGLGPETAQLIADAENLQLPQHLVSRLAALKTLHEDGATFSTRLKTAELEQRSLRSVLETNDASLRRVADSLNLLLARDDPRANQ